MLTGPSVLDSHQSEALSLARRLRFHEVYGRGITDTAVYSNPTVAKHVRTLTLYYSPPSPTEDRVCWDVLTRLSHVSKLGLYDVDWLYCTQYDRDRLRAAFGSIKELELVEGTWQHAEDLAFFLSAFPQLEHLEVQDCALYSDLDGGSLDLNKYPRQTVEGASGTTLRTLAVGWDEPPEEALHRAIMALLMSRIPRHATDDFRHGFAWSSSPAEFDMLHEYLCALGPILTELSVLACSGEDSCGTPPMFAIQLRDLI